MGRLWGAVFAAITMSGLFVPSASAEPKFPDIDSLPAVNLDDYVNPEFQDCRGGPMPQDAGRRCWPHEFRVGDVLCQNRNWKNYAYLECWDKSGAAPTGKESVAVGYARGPLPGKFYTLSGPDLEGTALLARSHELPVGHKIVFDWNFFERGKSEGNNEPLPFPMVCGVPEPEVIACRTVQKDAAYGFVLSPEGSCTF